MQNRLIVAAAWALSACAARPGSRPAPSAPPDPPAELARCEALLAAGEAAEAELACRSAREHGEAGGAFEARVTRTLGRASLARAKPDEAVLYLEEAVALEPTHAGGLLLLGRARMGLLHYALACDNFERVLGIDRTHAEALIKLASCRMYLGDIRPARAAYRRCLEGANPCDCERSAGVAALESRLTDSAVRHLDALVEACPEDAEGRALRCRAYAQAGAPAPDGCP